MNLKDIAKAAGVSTATVSRVLSGKDNVRADTRKRILEVVDRMNYRPNRAARSLRSRRSSFIGLIVADIQSPFFASLSRGVEDIAQKNDYSVILCNTDENPKKERMYLDMMQGENAAGVVVAPTLRLSKTITRSVADSCATVVIDRRVQGVDVDMVLIDNVTAAHDLTAHMLGHGYTRLAGLFGESSSTGLERRAGFEQALQDAGMPSDEQLVLHLPAREDAAHEAVSRFLELDNPPEAVITSNGMLAAGAFRALRDREISVPEEVAFATFDETPWTAMIRPSVTVVRQPAYALGQTAAEMLFKRIADPERPTRQVVLSSELVIRQSCGNHKE